VEVHDEQRRPLDVDRLGGLALHTLRQLDVVGTQVDITLVDVTRITELNREHMGGDGHTDVLAFPLDAPDDRHGGAPSLLGDVVLCPEVAAAQARAAGASERDELGMLLVHGILHLLGHDHAEPAERDVMFSLTDKALTSFRDTHDGEEGRR
jgi:probable rRNA maturation factor